MNIILERENYGQIKRKINIRNYKLFINDNDIKMLLIIIGLIYFLIPFLVASYLNIVNLSSINFVFLCFICFYFITFIIFKYYLYNFLKLKNIKFNLKKNSYMLNSDTILNDVLYEDYYLYSILERINYDYIPIIKKTYEINPILGIGKGLLGEIGLPIETHNYYIRVFMETGIIGLFIFISIFISIFIFLKDSIKYSNIGKVFLNFTLFLLIISFFQDAFANQKSLSLFSILFSIVSINEKRKLDNNSCYFIYKL